MRRKRRSPKVPVLPLVILDVAVLALSFSEAFFLRFKAGLPVPKGVPAFSEYLRLIPYVTAVCIAIFWMYKLYDIRKGEPYTAHFSELFKALSLSAVILVALTFFRRPYETRLLYSRYMVGISYLISMANLALGRYLLLKFLLQWEKRKGRLPRMLVLGTGEKAQHLSSRFSSAHVFGYELAGFVRMEGDAGTGLDGRVLGEMDRLSEILEGEKPDEVILTHGDLSREELLEIILECDRHMVELRIVPDLLDMVTSSVDIEAFMGLTTMRVKELPLDRGINRAMKRSMDLAFSAGGLVVLSPFLLAVSYCVKRDSSGPVLYKQRRVGQDGRRFNIYKFRSMKTDAEEKCGPVLASEDDPRRTRFGAFLRRTNLDELPQLWNVLRGDMSLVGPRPERPHFVDQFKYDVPRYMSRHRVKSGMTGWAQIHGLRGQTPIAERVRYDLYYVENWSLLLDLRILLKTFGATQNAY